ncbi:hypothetical protein [Brevibacillus daliensis]|uniref:hypothetical protein n=1 Tax=Brevibacillus daliensis TaxID=2892995 RepID=UPI001E42D8AE|nr:hypothetical protein [Brevibacillus daliensis]
MLKKMFTKSRTPHTVVVATDLGHIRILPVYSDQDGMLETAVAMFPKEEAKTYYDEVNGGLVYTFNLTSEAFTEAEQLKHLSQQVVLGKIFEFDTKKGATEFKNMLPYLIALIAIIF